MLITMGFGLGSFRFITLGAGLWEIITSRLRIYPLETKRELIYRKIKEQRFLHYQKMKKAHEHQFIRRVLMQLKGKRYKELQKYKMR